MAFKPTKAQQDAINQNGNILVSAAAGSGKTAVLVERVIQKLTSTDNPIRADELLIVTFTNAAAAEMRSRIEKRIDEECRNNPQNIGLLLQKNLLNNAKICTIDSFCIDLVRENFDKLGIAPDFKIAEENDLKAINDEVLYSIINCYFEQDNKDFLALLDLVGSEFDERNFIDLLLSVYNFSRQLPFPKVWYKEILENYNNGIFDSHNLWYKYAFEKANTVIESMENSIFSAKNLIYGIDKVYEAYYPVFEAAEEIIQNLKVNADTCNWDTFYESLQQYSLPKLPTVRGVGDIEEVIAVKDIYKHLNGKALDPLYKIFYADFEFINSQFEYLYPLVKLFIDILSEFDQKVFEAYKENNLFTFHNTEHLALELLCDYKDGEITVTDNGKELIEQYKEVMVDEYQDTNDLQNMLFYVLSGYEKRLFSVGDVKQSIYAFRGANPSNFLSKKNRYIPLVDAKDNDAKKIILGNNFRSKNLVCEFINNFFNIFMSENTGKIIYNSEEMLIPAAKFPETEAAAVSFDFIDCSETKEPKITLEARAIADFIKNIINGPACIKKDDCTLRRANYGDFTILLRNVSTKAPQLVNELENNGIPVNLNINNFSESVEITTFLSLLKVIDNPKNDVALATVLMSNIFGFTPEHLAQIRVNKRKDDLYSAIIFSAENGDKKAIRFLEKIEEFRLKSVTLPLSKLISYLLIDTEYLNIVSAMPNGEQRRNNLLLLCEFASNFSAEKTHSLLAFCDYILKLSSVNGVAKSGYAVNIMSIHASKGLQFPICIVANTSTRFNDAESRSSAAFSTKYGLGFKYFDETDKTKYTTISREVILNDIKSSQLEEELRLLYVAMTRAQDKLHFVGTFSNFEKAVENCKNLFLCDSETLSYATFSRTKSYADWLLLCLLINPEYRGVLNKYRTENLLENNKIKIRILCAQNLKSEMHYEDESFSLPNDDLVEIIKQNFEYAYPYQKLTEIQSKISVSVLANKAESDKFAFIEKPSFMSSNGITATGRGSAMHKIIEFFDFSKTDDIDSEIDRLYEWQYITEDEKNSLSKKALKDFFESEIFNRIKNADRVEREMRFLTEIPAYALDNTLEGDLAKEMVTLQGAVDICFIENGELIILDFKTDRVEDINELAVSYSEQLNAYAKACEKIFGLKVKEKIIYSFALSSALIIK